MLLPTMSLIEVRKEIEKDAPIFFRKANYVVLDLEKKLGKAALKEGCVKFFEYTSKYKNHWIYRVHLSRKQLDTIAMIVYHNGRGHAGVGVSPDLDIIYYTSHFFKRYNERRNLGLLDVNDIVRTYLNEAHAFNFEEIEEVKPGLFKIFGHIPSGVILGTFNQDLSLVKANTYISTEMLGKNQVELNTELKESLDKYIEEAGLLI